MIKWLLLLFAVLAVGIQLVPVDRAAPPAPAPIRADDAVLAILRRSCFDCHSSETRWPWYAYVAPISWSVADHVKEGRQHLNFSAWESLPDPKKTDMAGEAVEEIEEGEMPLPSYLRIHRAARVAPEELEVLKGWAASLGATDEADASHEEDSD